MTPIRSHLINSGKKYFTALYCNISTVQYIAVTIKSNIMLITHRQTTYAVQSPHEKENELILTVDYDFASKDYEIVSVQVAVWLLGVYKCTTDITEFFEKNHEAIDALFAAVDWHVLAAETMREREEYNKE